MPESIYLVGPMGAGKTTVGRALAKSLGAPFFDADQEISRRIPVPIAQFFEEQGEERFRRLECLVLDELTRLPGIVLATGGGAVLAAQNRAFLLTRGIGVYLHCSLEQQLARTSRSNHRPLLNSGDPREKLETLMKIRDPFYREIAEIVVDSSIGQVNKVVTEILRALRQTEPVPQ